MPPHSQLEVTPLRPPTALVRSAVINKDTRLDRTAIAAQSNASWHCDRRWVRLASSASMMDRVSRVRCGTSERYAPGQLAPQQYSDPKTIPSLARFEALVFGTFAPQK